MSQDQDKVKISNDKNIFFINLTVELWFNWEIRPTLYSTVKVLQPAALKLSLKIHFLLKYKISNSLITPPLALPPPPFDLLTLLSLIYYCTFSPSCIFLSYISPFRSFCSCDCDELSHLKCFLSLFVPGVFQSLFISPCLCLSICWVPSLLCSHLLIFTLFQSVPLSPPSSPFTFVFRSAPLLPLPPSFTLFSSTIILTASSTACVQ